MEDNQSVADYDYPLDPALIAGSPPPERDQSQLLIYHRDSGQMEHRSFTSLPKYLKPHDLLVLNDTRVFPARLTAEKGSGGRLELLFLRPLLHQVEQEKGIFSQCWEVLAKGKGRETTDLFFKGKILGRFLKDLGGGRHEVVIHRPADQYSDVYTFLERWGEIPLPPYILKRRKMEGSNLSESLCRAEEAEDRERYQTVYARRWGSAAAPTAGLHFTDPLLNTLREKGIQTATITLHIGLDTFQPMRSEKIRDHEMHREWYQVSEETASQINTTRERGGRVIAVGTTVTRVLETVTRPGGRIQAGEGETDLFITPGYRFKGTDALITNFHLPKSTLLVLLSAFAGKDVIRSVYREAIARRYRFYSYGDAMFVV
ncbi:MAG TPA: tRNA preQ1(34) S-adenosylmethionine ribosyltransferase-isomerase QueA [Nitrospiria bacterium]|nr:tRNA preQ1(34) S-adenosylmethionine ribosyltransferase-isomerase QueA [Candidatus Manganitrophaceae bacterium]HIL34065.1 tRNA preQ1(34) S-adenosylmethionine ribosyltransferase-isomerase QueA [Candidatus Manganitrophaceae bacterium]